MSDDSTFFQKICSLEKRKFYSFFSWIILVLAVGYLAYKLYNFNQYNELMQEWQQLPLERYGWLFFVLILLPANWLFESIKWKKIVSKTQDISLINAFKSVMSGFSTGFLTPNRTGDFVGRLMHLQPDNRKTGVTLSFINSLSQNIVIALCGIPASIYFFLLKSDSSDVELKYYYIILIVSIALSIALFFLLPTFATSKLLQRYSNFTTGIGLFKTTDLSIILFYSFFRYLIFSVQFYGMLHFFGVNLEPWQALIAIPANYLFVTFTPSVAFSEAAVRSSYAVFFISTFSNNVLNIALAGVIIWVVNFVIPMLIGTALIIKSTNRI